MRLLLLSFLYSQVLIACPESKKPTTSAKKEWLDAHNMARARKGVAPLAWSPKVAKVARSWARSLASSCSMYHSKGLGYGENLWTGVGYSSVPPIWKTVKSWVDEEVNYDPSQPGWSKPGTVAGHYTQVMWSKSKWLGCATSSCTVMDGKWKGKKRWLRVCMYDPKGNFRGQLPY